MMACMLDMFRHRIATLASVASILLSFRIIWIVNRMQCPFYVRLLWLKMIMNKPNMQKAKYCVNSRDDDSHEFKNLIRKLETAVL